jgi:hypothetical protein
VPSIIGLQGLARAFKEVPARLQVTMRDAVRMAAEEAAALARREHGYVDRTGELTNSIGADGPFGSLAGDDLNAIVSAGAAHALWVEKGTKPHKIRPRFRKALRFPTPGGSGFTFAHEVNHPGTKGTFFLAKATEALAAKLERELIPDAVELAFLQAGFGTSL